MTLKQSVCAQASLVFYVLLIPIVFALCSLPAAAEDMSGWSEDIGSGKTLTTNDIIAAADACADPVGAVFSGGFDPSDFKMVNMIIDPDSGHMVLRNDSPGMSAEKISIPFTQDVYATFLSEGSAAISDLGWTLYSDAVDENGVFIGWDSLPPEKKHLIFQRIADDTENFGEGDGVLDAGYGVGRFPIGGETALSAYDDGTGGLFVVDRDGLVTPRDMKKRLGRFAAGSEIVFFLATGRLGDPVGTPHVFFNKPWSSDRYDACIPDSGSPAWIDAGNGVFEKVFHLGEPAATGLCQVETNWLEARLLDRLAVQFDLHLSGEGSMEIKFGEFYAHMFGSTSSGDANRWVLGFEDKNASTGGADMDYNDLMFLVERLNGGAAQLDPAKSITPDQENARFTSVEIGVCDVQSAGRCAGKTALTYFVSPDEGANWIEITVWDNVRAFELDGQGAVVRGDAIDPVTWTPGAPAATCRRRSIDLIDKGVTGNRLLWKVEMQSTLATCTAEVIDVQLQAAAAINKTISRASPVIQANILYAGAVETPAAGWNDQNLRGHLTARRIYDPSAPNITLRAEEPLWDAGEALSAMSPDERRIFFPGMGVRRVDGEYLTDRNGLRLRGDGVRVTFAGFLGHAPVQATTLRIFDGRPEVFSGSGTSVLKGSLGGKGFIDHSSGRWEVTFNRPPAAGVPIMARYSWYTVDKILKPFRPENVTNDMLALTDAYIWPDGYAHDLNRDGVFDATAGQTDAAWLVNWVKGYRRPQTGEKKEWLLGSVNQSVPALMIPPGYPRWLYGTEVTAEEREGFTAYQRAHQSRPSVLFIGSGDGMLHAFDAGAFRHGDNPLTPSIKENRGYFLWQPKNENSPRYCTNYGGSDCPAYGTGRELWAFIPAGLMPRLKNNLIPGGERAQINSPPALSDVYIDTDGDGLDDDWRTILIGGTTNGDGNIFCLDVTDPIRPAFLWEFSAMDLIHDDNAQAVATIGRIRDPSTGEPKWVAFISTGRLPDADLFPAVYMLAVSDGSVLQRLTLDDAVDLNASGSIEDGEAAYGQAGTSSGPPVIVDSDDNGFVDRLYVGSNRGLVYKVNLPDDPRAFGQLTHCVVNTDFTDTKGNQIPVDQRRRAVNATPTVVIESGIAENDDLASRIRLVFGTGDSFPENAATGTTHGRNYILAYIDTAAKGDCNPNNHRLDWFYELEEDHGVRAPITTAAGRFYVGTTTSGTEDPCAAVRGGNDNLGLLTVMDLEGAVYLSRRLGNVHVAPLVEDQHIYLITPTVLQSLGSGRYNSALRFFGEAVVNVRSWETVD
ncbi:MAG: PilC/PilY family type IV pilus protein [Deltaproteobacteria bacterium]|nr:PilC/PilY family type IV pilus protein [Deltaproteobacteria bacterium]